MITFHKSKGTLDRILEIVTRKEKGAYLRFGDGDINLADNNVDLMQDPIPELAQELRGALSTAHPNVLKTLPLYCNKYKGLEPGMFPGNHECPEDWCDNIIERARPYWGGELEDVYSHVALSYTACTDPIYAALFLKGISKHETFFIGNENIPGSLIEKIFPNVSSCAPTKARDSYMDASGNYQGWIDKLRSSYKGYTLVVTCMGCSGRAIQKRLYRDLDNAFIFDFGSLMDALCGWDTRAWIGLSKFNSGSFLEMLGSV